MVSDALHVNTAHLKSGIIIINLCKHTQQTSSPWSELIAASKAYHGRLLRKLNQRLTEPRRRLYKNTFAFQPKHRLGSIQFGRWPH